MMDNATMRQWTIHIIATWTLLGCDGVNNARTDGDGSQAMCEAAYQAALDRSCSGPTGRYGHGAALRRERLAGSPERDNEEPEQRLHERQ